jgi:replicative DNA helicase
MPLPLETAPCSTRSTARSTAGGRVARAAALDEAESSVLGGLLLDNNAWDRVADVVSEGDFYRHEHR